MGVSGFYLQKSTNQVSRVNRAEDNVGVLFVFVLISLGYDYI